MVPSWQAPSIAKDREIETGPRAEERVGKMQVKQGKTEIETEACGAGGEGAKNKMDERPLGVGPTWEPQHLANRN